MKFLLDHCFAPRVAQAIAALRGEAVVHQHDKFARDAGDESILQALAEEGGWTILSGDLNLARLRHQRRALRGYKVTVFSLAPAWLDLPLWEQAAKLVRRWPEIEREAAAVEAGTMVEIPVSPAAAFRKLGR
ncbi:MAG: DUF5615 family PIN-like protein [Rhodospirillales bacterium]|nr:DUF5615 family PIN-like protein [Rhodospirillales bacterium]